MCQEGKGGGETVSCVSGKKGGGGETVSCVSGRKGGGGGGEWFVYCTKKI